MNNVAVNISAHEAYFPRWIYFLGLHSQEWDYWIKMYERFMSSPFSQVYSWRGDTIYKIKKSYGLHMYI